MFSLKLPLKSMSHPHCLEGFFVTTYGVRIMTRYINDVEVSKITGRAVQSLRNDRQKRIGIPYSKIGRSVRYSLDDVIDFMEARKIQTIGDAR